MEAANSQFLYELKSSLLSEPEKKFYECIKTVVPENYCVFPQSNLATFIKRTDNAKFQNELYRNIDFLITDADFKPLVAVEINDQTHNNYARKARDEKVHAICEEAGIEIVTFWTSYGVNADYISKRINTALGNFPPARKHNFTKQEEQKEEQTAFDIEQAKEGVPDQLSVQQGKQTEKGNKKLVVAGLICSILSFLASLSPFILQESLTTDVLIPVVLMAVFGIVAGILGIRNEKTKITGIFSFAVGILSVVFSLIIK